LVKLGETKLTLMSVEFHHHRQRHRAEGRLRRQAEGKPMIALLLAQAIAPDLTPVEIYKQAVATMHAIRPPSFVRFNTRVKTTIPHDVVVQHLEHVERTADRTVVTHDVDEKIDRRAKAFEIAPDLFLGHAVETKTAARTDTLSSGLDDTPSGEKLKTIGAVTVSYVHYHVQTVASEDLPDCARAIHLKLEPIADPLRYNLRDLWVDSATSRICKAVAVWNGYINIIIQRKRVVAPITLELDRSGFITHWSTAISARFLIGAPISIEQDGSYDNLEPIESSDFDAFKTKKLPSETKHS